MNSFIFYLLIDQLIFYLLFDRLSIINLIGYIQPDVETKDFRDRRPNQTRVQSRYEPKVASMEDQRYESIKIN